MLTTQKIAKMSTNEIVAKIAKLTNVSKIELQTLSRDELKTALTNMIATPEKIEFVTNFDDVLFFVYGDDGADDDLADVIADYEETYEDKVDDELYATLTDDEDYDDDYPHFNADGSLMTEEQLNPKEKTTGRPAKFNDQKLRKAFRHYARNIAHKAGKCWEKDGDNYLIDGELISWEKYVAEHTA